MADNRIDGSAPREKLYESMDDDPAKIAEDKAKLEYAAKQTTTRASCEKDSSQIPCASTTKDRTASNTPFTEIAKNMPATVPVDRDAVQKQADALSDRLSKNPEPYVGKKEDQAHLAELQRTLAATTEPYAGIPKTNDAGRKSDAKDGWLHGTSGHDGSSVYAGGTLFQGTWNGTKVQGGDVSAQVGLNTEVQATTVRITDSNGASTYTLAGPAVKAAVGIGQNDDGSMGYHAGVSASAATAQATTNLDNGGTATFGVSYGVGVGFSAGGKTLDDGDPGACFQVSAAFFTLGACLPVKM